MPTCEQQNGIDLAWLARQGLTEPGHSSVVHFSRAGRVAGSVRLLSLADGIRLAYWTAAGREVDEFVPFVTTETRFGGHRTWLRCPGCKTPRRVLFGGALFRCRGCSGLTYASQTARAFERAINRTQRLRVRLGGTGDLSQPFPVKPKGMHWRTYRRLEDLDRQLIGRLCSLGAAKLERRPAIGR